jgi:hypothetical protein
MRPRGLEVSDTSIFRHWLVRIIRAAIILEVAYLILFNLALYLPLTQSLVNAIRPEKFHVSWERAWTWYPFRAHVRGISANGQSRSQQWQVDAPSASASIAILPLVLKRVWLSNVHVEDIDYKQRPRLKPDRDYTDFIAFFPPIDGREIAEAVTTPRKKKRPWRLAIDGISLSGNHSYWVMQFSGGASGDLAADLTFETRGGPFSLSNGEANLKLDALYANAEHEIFHSGVVTGQVALDPFIPRENKGVKVLQFLLLDAALDIDVNSLAFINLFTRNFNQVAFDGSGQVAGQLELDKGMVLPGTDLVIEADDLSIDIHEHVVSGQGSVSLAPATAAEGWLDLSTQFRNPQVVHKGDALPLLKGDSLMLSMTGPLSVEEDPDKLDNRRNMSFSISSLSAPDLSLFEHYLPEKWPLDLHGGEGIVQGHASISPNALDIDLSISSDEADLGIRQYRFSSNLDAALKMNNPSANTSPTAIAGSYIKLGNARLSEDEGMGSEPWDASFRIIDGNFSVLRQTEKEEQEKLRDLLQLIGDSDTRELLGNLRGFMKFDSHISDLGWIGVLLDGAYGTAVNGSGHLNGVINLDEGMPAPGTDIEVLSDDLAVRFLDYSSSGTGRITMQVNEGTVSPDWLLGIQLQDADLMRLEESTAYIREVNLEISANVENVSLEKKSSDRSLALKIRSANVTDMSVFSSYLPPDSPLQLTDGTAALAADIVLEPDDADGWLTLQSTDLELVVDKQRIRSDLAFDIRLVNGIPSDMEFDFSGSRASLTNVHVIGEEETFEGDNWSAKVELEQATTVWKKPLQLNTEARVSILDSRPVVALFNNQGGKPDWLLEMLTIHDIEGKMKVDIADNQIFIPVAHAVSDTIEVGAKGRISEKDRDGVVYARYKKLDAVIKVSDGRKNTDLIRAREKYDEYQANSASNDEK